MKVIKNLLFIAALGAVIMTTSCGSDDSDSPESSATVTIDGTVYKKSSDTEIVYIEFTFNDESAYSIGGDVVNGTDTVNFSISVPAITVATYTKSTNGNEASISITPADESTYSTDVFGQDTDLTDYEIRITEATDKTISGTFTATVQSFSDENTKEVSGEFVALDFSAFFNF